MVWLFVLHCFWTLRKSMSWTSAACCFRRSSRKASTRLLQVFGPAGEFHIRKSSPLIVPLCLLPGPPKEKERFGWCKSRILKLWFRRWIRRTSIYLEKTIQHTTCSGVYCTFRFCQLPHVAQDIHTCWRSERAVPLLFTNEVFFLLLPPLWTQHVHPWAWSQKPSPSFGVIKFPTKII